MPPKDPNLEPFRRFYAEGGYVDRPRKRSRLDDLELAYMSQFYAGGGSVEDDDKKPVHSLIGKAVTGGGAPDLSFDQKVPAAHVIPPPFLESRVPSAKPIDAGMFGALRSYVRGYKDLFDKPISIAFYDRVFPKILADQRFKSQFETGTSEGSLDPDTRAIFEEKMFGLPRNIDPSQRPIYGHIADRSNPNTAGGYGNWNAVLDPSVNNRSSFFFGDSLGFDKAGPHGPYLKNEPPTSPNNRAQFQSWLQRYKDDLLRKPEPFEPNVYNLTDKGGWSAMPGNYVEAQIQGGVPWSDVQALVHKRPAEFGAKGTSQSDLDRLAAALTMKADLGDRPAYGFYYKNFNNDPFAPITNQWMKVRPGYSPEEIPTSQLSEIGYEDGGQVSHKLSKSSVDYSMGMGKTRCRNCAHFQKPHGCALVAGKINPGYWCQKFTAAYAEGGVTLPNLPSKGVPQSGPMHYGSDADEFADGGEIFDYATMPSENVADRRSAPYGDMLAAVADYGVNALQDFLSPYGSSMRPSTQEIMDSLAREREQKARAAMADSLLNPDTEDAQVDRLTARNFPENLAFKEMWQEMQNRQRRLGYADGGKVSDEQKRRWLLDAGFLNDGT